MDELIKHRGQIVLISSVFAFLNGMGVIPYAMTKTAVEALGRGLRIELAGHGVTTTTAYFSLINTKMIKDGVDADPVVGQLLNALPPPFRLRLPPETAAAALVDGLAVVHPGSSCRRDGMRSRRCGASSTLCSTPACRAIRAR